MTEERTQTKVRWGAGDLAALIVVIFWGANFIVVKQVLTEMSPLAFNSLRFISASLLLLVWLRLSGEDWRIARADVPRVLVLGLIGITLYQVCFIIGVNLTTAGNASLILATSPPMVVILGALMHVGVAGRRTWLGVVLALLGLALVIGGAGTVHFGSDTIRGDLLCLVSAASWAIYVVFGQGLFLRYSSLKATAVTMAAGTPLLVLIALPEMVRQDWGAVSVAGWAGLAYSAVCSIALGYVLFYTGVKLIGATRTSTYQNLPPIIAVVLGSLILGESMAPLQIAGAIVVLIGVTITRRSGR